MALFKWMTESAAAWAAIGITTCGGIYTTAVHNTAINTAISQIQKQQADTDTHVAKHDDQLSTIQQQNAASAQSLSDIKDQLNRIEKKL
jgi:septal ring factor EnvC (AmiA/AmiB activator)